MKREPLDHGSVLLATDRCRFVYRPLQPGALLITIDGNDSGEFGHATLEEIELIAARSATPLRVYIDPTRATGPSTSVMETWTAWLAAKRDLLERLIILIPENSKLLHLTVSIAQHLSRTGNLIRICSNQAEFDDAVGRHASVRA